MAESSMTPFSSKCEILADLWLNYRTEEDFADFIEYNDLGLPLSYAVANNLATINDTGEGMINETFDLLLAGIGLEDTGFETLDDVMGAGGYFLEEDED